MKEIIGDYTDFVLGINAGLYEAGINFDELAMLDHICYRVETLSRYKEMLTALGGVALFLGEAQVSGRAIATFEFNEPLQAGGWHIPYLELPEPKDGSPYSEGLEHAEFVVIGDVEKFATRHTDLDFDRKGMSKLINPELGLKTDTLSVKFHEQPLGAVVRIEQRLEQN